MLQAIQGSFVVVLPGMYLCVFGRMALCTIVSYYERAARCMLTRRPVAISTNTGAGGLECRGGFIHAAEVSR